MRSLVLLSTVALLAAPLEAQKPPKRDRYKIMAEELVEYQDQNVSEVISKARPHFFQFYGGGTSGLGEATLAGESARLLVYIGQQAYGDSSVLRHYRASEVKEIRYYKPSEAITRLGANNAFVIQVIPKVLEKK